jgi:Na+/melibiose symporter-like transporter
MAVCFALAIGFISRYDLDRKTHTGILEEISRAKRPDPALASVR